VIDRTVRRRLLAVLFTGSALTRTGFISLVTVAALAAEDLLGSAGLAGMPGAAATVGLAVGTAPLAGLMARRGRRPGIALGLGTTATGGAIVVVAFLVEVFALFVLGMFVFGFGMAGDRLSRYGAADVSEPAERSFSISLVVWAGTVGSVLGPLLLDPVTRAAEALGADGLVGPAAFASLMTALAATFVFVMLRPDPLEISGGLGVVERREDRAPLGPLLRSPRVRYALVALAIGQVVMVLIMTMTPVHIRRAGEAIGIVGLVIGAHTFGMFAVSPLTGVLADRVGRLPVMIAGQVILVIAATLAAFAGGDATVLLVISLFLLGLGWNFGFVAGSAYLTEQAPLEQRVRLQGVGDAVTWTSAAIASLSSGALLELSGYAALCVVGVALVGLPTALLVRYRWSGLQPQPA
jgi:MFS family permease